MKLIIDKSSTEVYYIERTVYRKDVDCNNNLIFELGNKGESSPILIIVTFQARKKLIQKHIIMQHLIDLLFPMLIVK